MIKDGYVNVLGVLVPNNVDEVMDEDNKKLIVEPCPICHGHDQEVVADDIFEPTGYRLKCAAENCTFEVPEELMVQAYFHDDGVREAVKAWNAHVGLVDLINSGELQGMEEIPQEVKNELDTLPEGFVKVENKDGSISIVNQKTGEVLK